MAKLPARKFFLIPIFAASLLRADPIVDSRQITPASCDPLLGSGPRQLPLEDEWDLECGIVATERGLGIFCLMPLFFLILLLFILTVLYQLLK